METCYKDLDLTESVNLTSKNQVTHVWISTSFRGGEDNRPSIIGCFPYLTTSAIFDFMTTDKSLLSNSHYIVSIMARFTASRWSITPKRITTLDLHYNRIQSISSSRSYQGNERSMCTTRFPVSLLYVNISYGDIFRASLNSSTRGISCIMCTELKEIKHKECILFLSHFLTHNRRPRTNQKSLRLYNLSFYVLDEFDEYKGISFAQYGIYNDLLRVKSYNVFVYHSVCIQ